MSRLNTVPDIHAPLIFGNGVIFRCADAVYPINSNHINTTNPTVAIAPQCNHLGSARSVCENTDKGFDEAGVVASSVA